MSGSALRRLLVPKTPGISPDEVFAIGRPEILKASLTNTHDCGSSEACVLDSPIAYDLLEKRTYNSAGSTYYDALKDLVRPFTGSLSTTPEREPLAFEFLKKVNKLMFPKNPRTVITIPKTQAVWFLRNGIIYHLNKRGVSIEDVNGRCVPADIMPCNPCQWATSEHMCQPCSVASKSVAWSVQCAGCSTSRRLLATASVNVTVTIGNSSAAELVRLFSGTVKDNSIVTVESSNPAETLRLMSSEISKHPGWVVISQPQAVYGIQTNVSRRSLGNGTVVETASSDDLPGWAIALIVIVSLLAVAGVAYALYLSSLPDKSTTAGPDDQTAALLPKEIPVQPTQSTTVPTGRLFHIKIDHPRSA
jgi:hypothetical protein